MTLTLIFLNQSYTIMSRILQIGYQRQIRDNNYPVPLNNHPIYNISVTTNKVYPLLYSKWLFLKKKNKLSVIVGINVNIRKKITRNNQHMILKGPFLNCKPVSTFHFLIYHFCNMLVSLIGLYT